jgi:hypothetical protein
MKYLKQGGIGYIYTAQLYVSGGYQMPLSEPMPVGTPYMKLWDGHINFLLPGYNNEPWPDEYIDGYWKMENSDEEYHVDDSRLENNMKDFKLCYIEERDAYFTTQDLSLQWGDDWDDAPYEYNAEPPYKPRVHYYSDGTTSKIETDWNSDGTPKWEILKIKFELDWTYVTPEENFNNPAYSVKDINAGLVPWIFGTSYDGTTLSIPAGTSVEDFKKMVKSVGGKIFVEEP